ncbi:MAG TPA: hypothetical protein VIM14_16875, partial [Polyangia bacterium]
MIAVETALHIRRNPEQLSCHLSDVRELKHSRCEWQIGPAGSTTMKSDGLQDDGRAYSVRLGVHQLGAEELC